MSFYTHNKPRLVESNIYHKLLRKQHYSKFEKSIKNEETNFFEDNNFIDSLKDFLKNNWSFLLILSILIFILAYRYNVIKEDLQLKKARKQYIDQLIMDNYRKEKRLELERENNTSEDWENQELINETLNEYQVPDMNLQNNILPQINPNIQDPINNSFDPINQDNSFEPVNQDNSFNNYFNSKVDQTFEPFYGNSSFAPF